MCDQNSVSVRSNKKNKRYPKNWHFKYKYEEKDFQNVEKNKGMGYASLETLGAFWSINRKKWRCCE